MSKKLFWIKLNKDFFQDLKIKKIRSVAGGDTYTCIYLELLLLSLDDEGVIFYEGIEPSIEEELALKTGESIINIKAAFAIFESLGLLQRGEDDDVRFPKAVELSGGECESTERVRKFRAKQKALKNTEKALHVTECNVTSNEGVTDEKQKCNPRDRVRDREEKEEELEKEREYNAHTCVHTHEEDEPKRKRFIKPTLQELEEYKANNALNTDCQNFFNYYESKGWVVGKAPMKDWRAAMRNWSLNESRFNGAKPPSKEQSSKLSIEDVRRFGGDVEYYLKSIQDSTSLSHQKQDYIEVEAR
ncbi:phage replisome organizer N-terminal domain-containing protein [Campylobacter majalis]|uniref:phage replisome organizer N-terminal domain-containing protein n=1 Tax=Campylobacter majalis TaxID=2790656 RepID=UPI003D683E8E